MHINEKTLISDKTTKNDFSIENCGENGYN